MRLHACDFEAVEASYRAELQEMMLLHGGQDLSSILAEGTDPQLTAFFSIQDEWAANNP